MAEEFKLPEVGEGIESGTVVAVLVSVGDTIEVDQPVLELETDKAVVEVPSSVAGVVEAIHVEENAEAAVGQVVLTVGAGDGAGAAPAGDGDAAAADASGDDAAADEDDGGPVEGSEISLTGEPPSTDVPETAAAPAASASAAPSSASAKAYDGGGGSLIPAAPSVRRLARELGVDIAAVQGSGILGRISAADVRAYADGKHPVQARPAAGAPAPSAPAFELPDFSKFGDTHREPMSGIRKATVRSMTTAWSTVPMVTHFDKADITRFEQLRKEHQPKAQARDAKLTPTAMLIKIVAAALKKFPDFNASIDTESNEIVYKHYVNVGVAVDTDYGLLVPVIKDADRKNMLDLAVELGELADKARARKLAPDDMQGGNFSVSNLGGIGGHGFTPIVNPPDVAILGVSRGGYEPVYDRETGEFEPRLMMPMSVTYDHRLIDGAQAARFLRWVCTAIEEPFLLSLEG